MEKHSNKYIHALRTLPGIGNGTLTLLLEHFGDGERIWQASREELSAVPGLLSGKKSILIAERNLVDPENLWEKLLALGITLHTKKNPTYPRLLREIPDSPCTLYTRGSYHFGGGAPTIAIVGSRKYSQYGEQVAYKLSQDLTHAGWIVVSGMAFGIDSHAHHGVLEAGGETLAVLGSGIDDPMISPVSHFSLAKRIMSSGALISEYPPGTQASKGSFPMRDRIIAGLCLGTLVIEAPEKSGSLITARCALDYNREVFAVPGSIFSPYSVGTNALIKKGAKIVTGIQDILEEFTTLFPLPILTSTDENSSSTKLEPEERKILAVLTHEPLHIDKIIKLTTLATAKASSLLTILEIKGLVKNSGGMYYVRM